MLGVGIDWAEKSHVVALGRPGEGVIEIARVKHTAGAVDALIVKIAQKTKRFLIGTRSCRC